MVIYILKVAICDDNISHIDDIKNLLKKYLSMEYEVYGFTDESNFLMAIKKGEEYDIIFLDMVLKKADGLTIGRSINKYLPKAQVIFITVDINFCQDVHEINHAYFLVKPVADEKFKKAMVRAINLMRQSMGKYINADTANGKKKIYFNYIKYFENSHYYRRIQIILENGQKEIMRFYSKLDDVEETLPSPLFIRCHQSFIINASKVTEYKGDKFILEEITVNITRKYRKSAKKKYEEYLLSDFD